MNMNDNSAGGKNYQNEKENYTGVYAFCVRDAAQLTSIGDTYTCNRIDPGSVVGVRCFGQTMLLIIFRCVPKKQNSFFFTIRGQSQVSIGII